MINYSDYELPQPAVNDQSLYQYTQSPDLIQTLFPLNIQQHNLDQSLLLTQNLQLKITPILDLIETFEESASVSLNLNLPSNNVEEPLKQKKSGKNQTKNIPKNFGKGIINFIEKHEKKIRGLLKDNGISFNFFISSIRSQKKHINTISDIRKLWTNQIYGKIMRILSNIFFRRHALSYIFNSRIHNYESHIKYRQTLWTALKNPHDFNRIKEF